MSIFTLSDIDDLVIGTLEAYRPPSLRVLLGLRPDDPLPEAKPLMKSRREPKVFVPPPRRDFVELRERIWALDDEIEQIKENSPDEWYEGTAGDEEADELRKLEDELSRLEHLSDSVGALSGAVRRIV